MTFAQQQLRLWYTNPAAQVWENALPIGNGRMGAMIYGNVATETIQLNEHTLWSGSPNSNDNPMSKEALPQIRSLIFNGERKEAERLANQTVISKQSHGQIFQTFGDLVLNFEGHQKYTKYYRDLDISNAVATTRYEVAGVTYTRKAVASLKDGIIAIEITASRPAAISFAAKFKTVQPHAKFTSNSTDQIEVGGTVVGHEGVEGKLRFKGLAKFKNKGGSISETANEIIVKDADAVVIYLSIATNFIAYNNIDGDENIKAQHLIDKAFIKDFNEIYTQHRNIYQRYFNRVDLNLGVSKFEDLPTDTRLKNFNAVDDPSFAALYFQYGRYLLISSSQPGGQPANLQGIWNNKLFPAWDSKYTININAEMNYWPAERTNLPELHEPFLKMVRELAETGAKTARNMYGARGWMAHHNTDVWRATGAVDGAFWGMWVHGGGWSSQHLWEHFLYSGDKKFLRQTYPILKGAAMFYVDFLVKEPKTNFLVINPDMSPENAPPAHQGSSLDAGTTMSNQIVYDVFSSVIRAGQLLGKDKNFIDTLKRMRDELPPMHIGKFGQLQEWLEDLDSPNDKHRHVSHLYGLFPSNQINPYLTPKLYAAAQTTLLQRGDVSTGWSMGWKVNWWARLLNGNHAFKLIQSQLTPVGINEGGGGTYNNLFDAHPPFQIDGNFGCTSGISEMLVQSGADEIHLLPALPDVWKKEGIVKGLRAKGGFEVAELEWKNGVVTKLVINSKLGGNLRIKVPNRLVAEHEEPKRAAGENPNLFYFINKIPEPIISTQSPILAVQTPNHQCYDMSTKKGRSYTFYNLK